jgi:Tol biopolymer transport system component
MPASGGAGRRLVPAALGLQRELDPQVSGDGQWIYFGGGAPSLQDHTEIWRIHPDGTGAERVGEPADMYDGDRDPSPASDGSAVIFGTDRRNCCFSSYLRVLYLGTGVVDTLYRGGLLTPGWTPRFSPVDPTVVAYLSEDYATTGTSTPLIWLMKRDGSERRALTTVAEAYRPHFDWSPDGRWIIAQSGKDARLHLIEVATGLTLPLGYSTNFSLPSWRP